MAVKLSEADKLMADRKEWESQYVHWLTRKNNFYEKLVAAGRNPATSPKYQELRDNTQKWWQKLRDTYYDWRKLHRQA
jgi:hypothetical protein